MMKRYHRLVLVLSLALIFLTVVGASVVFAQEGKKLVFGNIAFSRKDVWNNYSILAFE